MDYDDEAHRMEHGSGTTLSWALIWIIFLIKSYSSSRELFGLFLFFYEFRKGGLILYMCVFQKLNYCAYYYKIFCVFQSCWKF